MDLVVDVGNTESVIGVFEPGSLEVYAHWRYSTAVPRTEDELFLLLRSFLAEKGLDVEDILRAVVGSVVPMEQERLRRALARMGGKRVRVLEDPADLPIRLDVEEPRTVGMDRIANTLAVANRYSGEVIVVDLGTATTYDCIDAGGVFMGGVIAPGLKSGQEWLHEQTAKLPLVEFRPPARVIGRRTESCLHSGIFYSAVDAVDGIVTRIREEWGRGSVRVIATGGLAGTLAPHSRTIDEVQPHLTLEGLVLAGRYLDGEPVRWEGG
jgi:type III pantothenate kinase